jgi:ribonuclease G
MSLPGRFWILLPKEDRIGVSRRVESVDLHSRLRRLAQDLKGQGQGLIARTAAQWASKAELERDYLWLAETWEAIELAAQGPSSPKLLYKAMGLVQTILRDRLLPDVSEVIVDSPFFREKILSFLQYLYMEEYRGRIRLYQGKTPLFEHYHVQEQIQEILSSRVDLSGGGSIVIDETEALTVIDVNSGADVKHRNQQAAILSTNLEAAKEIGRQLRLRKISGIIIVDFIDMEEASAVQKLIDEVKKVLNEDRVSADFIDLTPLSLMEITRKREGESLAGMLENADFDP